MGVHKVVRAARFESDFSSAWTSRARRRRYNLAAVSVVLVEADGDRPGATASRFAGARPVATGLVQLPLYLPKVVYGNIPSAAHGRSFVLGALRPTWRRARRGRRASFDYVLDQLARLHVGCHPAGRRSDLSTRARPAAYACGYPIGKAI